MGLFGSKQAVISKANQDLIQEMNRIKMERWIQMHQQINARQEALKLAKRREMFYWEGAGYFCTVYAFVGMAKYTKRPTWLWPIVPLTFIFGYEADNAYGSKRHRIQAEADIILHNDKNLNWPGGCPTISSIDQARLDQELDAKLHPQ